MQDRHHQLPDRRAIKIRHGNITAFGMSLPCHQKETTRPCSEPSKETALSCVEWRHTGQFTAWENPYSAEVQTQ